MKARAIEKMAVKLGAGLLRELADAAQAEAKAHLRFEMAKVTGESRRERWLLGGELLTARRLLREKAEEAHRRAYGDEETS